MSGPSVLRGSTLDEYQRRSMRTHSAAPERFPCYALGLAGEAGEVFEAVASEDKTIAALGMALAARVADRVKKNVGHGHELDRDALIKELGDVLWYVAGIAHVHEIPLSQIAFANVLKLAKRYPDGFSHEASRARVDVDLRPKAFLGTKKRPAAQVSRTLARNKAKVHL